MTAPSRFPTCRPPKYRATVLLVFFAGALACSTSLVAPFVVRYQVPVEGPKVLFLASSEQKARIESALGAAGFDITRTWKSGEYQLRIDIGAIHQSRDCGTLNNIRYRLISQGQEALQLKGRGWTGTCTPNIFDAMSEQLASYFP